MCVDKCVYMYDINETYSERVCHKFSEDSNYNVTVIKFKELE